LPLNGQKPEMKKVRFRTLGCYPLSGAIESEASNIDDIIDVFFLQIQGSGLVQLENGEQVHVGYADQNGHPYNSIGRLLVERGELTLAQASMQGIKNWARNNMAKLRELLNANPSYVFFRELPAGIGGAYRLFANLVSNPNLKDIKPNKVFFMYFVPISI
jgi:membrane-bound lytic murein transglycosylase